ncbi:MAG: hypothetical protein PHC88_10450 [Terrimicrobiaceae bacterium]|nr:hypothetical protein [Terrimicrobiaceae bacterium]
MPDSPRRRSLPHDVPSWIDSTREIYFLTVCCRRRGQEILTRPAISAGLLETVATRNARHVWYAHLFLLMPDHVHALVRFPEAGQTIRTRVAKWKEWTSKCHGIEWQRDYFEHRLRREESLRDKADYILNNPVRRGLVQSPEHWPHVFFGDR